jgi:hypothetical protein
MIFYWIVHTQICYSKQRLRDLLYVYLSDPTVSSNFLDNTCDSSFHLQTEMKGKKLGG